MYLFLELLFLVCWSSVSVLLFVRTETPSR
jgi:hypothetical protein